MNRTLILLLLALVLCQDCSNRKDVYTYKPEENEYYLDMVRDSGDVFTDYNLEPVQKLVDRWNDAKKWNNESIVKLKTFSDIINYKSILE